MANRRSVTLGQTIVFHLDGDADGDHWIQARIEDGRLVVKACDGLAIRPYGTDSIELDNVR